MFLFLWFALLFCVWETATNFSNSIRFILCVFDLDCVSLYFEFYVFLNTKSHIVDFFTTCIY